MNGARRPIVAGNWKMHKLRREAAEFCDALVPHLPIDEEGGEGGVQVVLFPSFPLLPDVAAALEPSAIALGGQDLHPAEQGAHTGDVSAPQLIDAGCTWVLCGHSERRADHRESDELIAAKVAAALEHGLTPMVCIGETKEERQAGTTFDVLDRQLERILDDLPGECAFAYEPVWAIGTGETATPEIAQEVHAYLRRTLGEALGPEQAAMTQILYGGSVNPENAASLIAEKDIDGFLVGGASLDPEKFLTIIRRALRA